MREINLHQKERKSVLVNRSKRRNSKMRTTDSIVVNSDGIIATSLLEELSEPFSKRYT